MGAVAEKLPTSLPQRSALAIKKLIAIATAGSGVRVAFQGRQAYTDGKVIVLPAMMDAKAERLALGYAWHESFHIQWTDFTAVDGWQEAIRKTPILKSLENVLEDGRIERMARRDYPGTHRVLNALIEALVEQGGNLFDEPDDGTHPANLLMGFVLNWTRKEINGYAAIVYLDQWRAALAEAIGEQAVVQIEEILDANRLIDSTQESFSVAKEVLDVLQPDEGSDSDEDEGDGDPSDSGDSAGDEGESEGDSQPDSTDEEDDQQGEGNESQSGGNAGSDDEPDDASDDSSGGGDSAQEGSDRGGSDEDSAGESADEEDESKGEPNSSQPDGDGGSEAGGNAGDGDQPDRSDQERQNRQSIDEASEDDLEMTDLGDLAQEELNDQQEATAGSQGAGGGFRGGVEIPSAMVDREIYGRIAAPASALASRLRGILQAEAHAEVPYARRSGKRIHRRALHRVAMDDSRIWRKRAEAVDVSAAVHVLLDTSGSMGGLETELSTYGLAAARAVEQTDGLTVSASTLINSHYGCTLLKGPHESCMAVAGRFSSIRIGGGTPMAEAMEVAMPLLREADAGHRVMVVFTDGDPNSASAVEQQMLENPTVKFCAVILGSALNQLETLMPCARIDTMQQLPKVVTDLVRQAITSQRGAA